LLQGPPGTGKTRTILALVATVLVGGTAPPQRKTTRIVPGEALRKHGAGQGKESREFLQSLYAHQERANAAANSSGSSNNGGNGNGNGNGGGCAGSSRTRVLVCAPSNTAVDEVAYVFSYTIVLPSFLVCDVSPSLSLLSIYCCLLVCIP
jgi:hypothetical protein